MDCNTGDNLVFMEKYFEAGIGIVEVLLALVILSLGALGMVSLQLTGIKHSTSGYSRLSAVILAENIASRIRSNPVAIENGDYAGFDSNASAICSQAPAKFCQVSYGEPAGVCNSQEMAAFDLYSVACGTINTDGVPEDGVADLLSGGRLQVFCDDSPCEENSTYTLTISWNEARTTERTDAQDIKTVQLRFDP